MIENKLLDTVPNTQRSVYLRPKSLVSVPCDYLVSFCNKLLCLRLALSVAPSQMSCKVLTAEIWADDTVTPSTSQRSQIRPWWVRVKFQNILPFPLFWTTNDMPGLLPETRMSSVF